MSSYDSAPRQTNTGLLVGSILATLFCCLPLGVVAIVMAAQGKDDKARLWLIVTVVVGFLFNGGVGFLLFND